MSTLLSVDQLATVSVLGCIVLAALALNLILGVLYCRWRRAKNICPPNDVVAILASGSSLTADEMTERVAAASENTLNAVSDLNISVIEDGEFFVFNLGLPLVPIGVDERVSFPENERCGNSDRGDDDTRLARHKLSVKDGTSGILTRKGAEGLEMQATSVDVPEQSTDQHEEESIFAEQVGTSDGSEGEMYEAAEGLSASLVSNRNEHRPGAPGLMDIDIIQHPTKARRLTHPTSCDPDSLGDVTDQVTRKRLRSDPTSGESNKSYTIKNVRERLETAGDRDPTVSGVFRRYKTQKETKAMWSLQRKSDRVDRENNTYNKNNGTNTPDEMTDLKDAEKTPEGPVPLRRDIHARKNDMSSGHDNKIDVKNFEIVSTTESQSMCDIRPLSDVYSTDISKREDSRGRESDATRPPFLDLSISDDAKSSLAKRQTVGTLLNIGDAEKSHVIPNHVTPTQPKHSATQDGLPPLYFQSRTEPSRRYVSESNLPHGKNLEHGDHSSRPYPETEQHPTHLSTGRNKPDNNHTSNFFLASRKKNTSRPDSATSASTSGPGRSSSFIITPASRRSDPPFPQFSRFLIPSSRFVLSDDDLRRYHNETSSSPTIDELVREGDGQMHAGVLRSDQGDRLGQTVGLDTGTGLCDQDDVSGRDDSLASFKLSDFDLGLRDYGSDGESLKCDKGPSGVVADNIGDIRL